MGQDSLSATLFTKGADLDRREFGWYAVRKHFDRACGRPTERTFQMSGGFAVHSERKYTGPIAASAAPICNAKTRSVCRGTRGSHLNTKNASTGSCPAISSCQICAIVPSSSSRTTEPAAMAPKNSASAATDISIGIKALGFLLSKRTESGY